MGLVASTSKIFLKKIFLISLSAFFICNIFVYFIPNKSSQDNLQRQSLSITSETAAAYSTSEESGSSNFPDAFKNENSLQLIQSSQNDTDTIVRHGHNHEGRIYNRPKKVLIWNAYWESTAMWHKIFYEIIYRQCPQSNCLLTVDKSELKNADAVLFHLVDIARENYTFPSIRNPNQIWIGMTYEPPYILKFAKLNFTLLNGIFNRTMTYRSDSDIVVRHGTYLKISKDTRFPNYLSNWLGSHQGVQERNYAEGKRRLVSWFASSRGCRSQSRREKYIQQLQKHIPVDIFGACGPYRCGTQKTMRNPYKVEHDDCYLLVSVAYKFVLAFENSVCDDYVTEKLYNHLKLNVVPVVFGGADYTHYAPPHSIIDASKYTPQELADYLSLLDKNDTLYNEYFAWKKNFYIASHDGIPLACDLCEQLHNPNWQIEKKVYEKFDSWIESGCSKGWYSKSISDT